MHALRSKHLFTLVLKVNFAGMIDIGQLPHGRRRIAPVEGGTFTGERLNGTVLPGGADWVLIGAQGAMRLDVRLALKTDDEAMIDLRYQGHFHAAPELAKRFHRGEPLAPSDFYLRTSAQFETAASRYAWLNQIICVGSGVQAPGGVAYEMFEVL